MKRKLFFLLDRLQIQRSERIALSVLLFCTVLTCCLWLVIDSNPAVNDEYYTELEKVFHERSKQQKEQEQMIMARYQPENSSAIKSDNLLSEKSEEIVEPVQEMADTTRININTADAENLQALPGVGPAYAARIIDWRKENGKFTTIEQLLEIKGIGPARLNKIRELIEL